MTERNGYATPESLRLFRARWHLSQSDLGSLLGVHKFTVSRWERDAQTISQPRILFLALMDLRGRLIRRERRRTARTPRAAK